MYTQVPSEVSTVNGQRQTVAIVAISFMLLHVELIIVKVLFILYLVPNFVLILGLVLTEY